MENKILRTKGSGCEFCNIIYDGYAVKDHPLIYYSKGRFVLTSQYHGHGGTKELEGIKYCPYCASDLFKRLITEFNEVVPLAIIQNRLHDHTYTVIDVVSAIICCAIDGKKFDYDLLLDFKLKYVHSNVIADYLRVLFHKREFTVDLDTSLAVVIVTDQTTGDTYRVDVTAVVDLMINARM